MNLNIHSEVITSDLLTAIRDQYRLDWHGIHGIEHWLRVRENGLRIAKAEGANPKVVELFAVLHDACRHNDDHDPDHGPRAAQLAKQFRNRYFNLTDDEFAELTQACHDHTLGQTEAPITVQTCWDADRLDLGRVEITISAEFLCTQTARSDIRFSKLGDLAEKIHELHIQDVAQINALIKPEVDEIIQTRNQNTKRIEKHLDILLDFAFDDSVLVLYKRLCRHYYSFNPQAATEYIHFYREMWDSEE